MIVNKIQAFYTAARHYCINRINNLENDNLNWCNKFQEIYTRVKDFRHKDIDELYKQYPKFDVRIRILEMVLNEIESIQHENIFSITQLKEALNVAIHKSSIHYGNGFARTSANDIIMLCNDEKQSLYDFINSINEENLSEIEPIPYRKVLSYEDIGKIKEKLKSAWLDKVMNILNLPCENILPIEYSRFFNIVGKIELVSILKNLGVEWIWMVDTCSLPPVSYKMDISLLDMYKVSGDVYWCIIRNHEGFIYICGEALIRELKNMYPDFN